MKLNGKRLTLDQNRKLIRGLHTTIGRTIETNFRGLCDAIDLENNGYIELKTWSGMSKTTTIVEKPLHPATSVCFYDAERAVTWVVDDQLYEMCKEMTTPEFMFIDAYQPGVIYMGTIESMGECYHAGGYPKRWTGERGVIGQVIRVPSEKGYLDMLVKRYVAPVDPNKDNRQLGC